MGLGRAPFLIGLLPLVLVGLIASAEVAESQPGFGHPAHEVGPREAIGLDPGVTVTPSDLTDEGPLTIEGPAEIVGTADQPIRFEVPVHIETRLEAGALVENSTFAPVNSAGGCALTVEGPTASVRNSAFTGATHGLCLKLTARQTENYLLLEPFRGHEFTPVDSRHGPAPVELVNNAYSENNQTGLLLDSGERGQPDAVAEAVSRNEIFHENGIGIHMGYDVRLLVEDATVRANEIGLRHEEGAIAFDHTTFEENHAWDVYSTGEHQDLQFRATSFDPSCVHFESAPNGECQRGSLSASGASMVIALATSIIFLVSEAGKFLLTRVGLALRLFSRIPPSELLEHDTRRQLVILVEDEPGACIAHLARLAEIPRGTAVYHLARLERGGILRSKREGIYRRFYPVAGEGDRQPRSIREKVLAEIRQNPGVHASEIARRLDVSRQLVSYHLENLQKKDMIRRRQNNQIVHLFPKEDVVSETEGPVSAPPNP